MGGLIWHKALLVPRPSAVETSCAVCGQAIWLPKSKIGIYKTCGEECKRAAQRAGAESRRRPCETCGADFTPRQVQLDNGGGRFCSQKCNTALREAGNTESARAKRRVTRLRMEAAGLIKRYRGEENPRWMGGPKASRQRQIESGKAAARLRLYRAENRERVREWRYKRSNGKVMPRLPWGTIPRLGTAQRWKCAICRVGIKGGYHIDHIMPIAKGGKHEPRNLQLLCQSCNVRKAAKDPIAYMQELGRLL